MSAVSHSEYEYNQSTPQRFSLPWVTIEPLSRLLGSFAHRTLQPKVWLTGIRTPIAAQNVSTAYVKPEHREGVTITIAAGVSCPRWNSYSILTSETLREYINTKDFHQRQVRFPSAATVVWRYPPSTLLPPNRASASVDAWLWNSFSTRLPRGVLHAGRSWRNNCELSRSKLQSRSVGKHT